MPALARVIENHNTHNGRIESTVVVTAPNQRQAKIQAKLASMRYNGYADYVLGDSSLVAEISNSVNSTPGGVRDNYTVDVTMSPRGEYEK